MVVFIVGDYMIVHDPKHPAPAVKVIDEELHIYPYLHSSLLRSEVEVDCRG